VEEGGMIDESERELHKKERSAVYKRKSNFMQKQWQRMEAATVGELL
jgi:hypothetical protein